MKNSELFLVTTYDHFYKMKASGRSVVPWFQTCFSIALVFTISLSLLLKITMDIINGGYYHLVFQEVYFLTAFILVLVMFFFIIKHKYFDSGRHLSLYEEYLTFSIVDTKKYKFIVLTILCGLPFLLLFIIYLDDKYFRI